jgi:hypothetical protein
VEGAPKITEQESIEVKNDYNFYYQVWARRRRDCFELVGSIAENVDVREEELFRRLCLDEDADFGVSISEFKCRV